jgi:hypothetical protein
MVKYIPIMTMLQEKIASLPPSLLPMVEDFIDSLPLTEEGWDDWEGYDPKWEAPLYDENGKKIHPTFGCLPGLIVIKDDSFETDGVWEEYI